ncbi:hypothetical protein GmHk_09G026571 [Glycine max]|nr:hypothetical protein GmHk_09G026571 [Glycine max]
MCFVRWWKRRSQYHNRQRLRWSNYSGSSLYLGLLIQYSSSSTQYPECVNVRPCSYYATISSFLSRFSGADDGVGSVGCVHNLIEQESGLRRSRSMEILFLLSRSRFSGSGGCGGDRLSDLESTRDLSARKLQKPFGEVVQKSSRHDGGGTPEQEWEAKKILAEEQGKWD